MPYHSLEACLTDLEKHGHLVRIKELVDPNLEMAAIHLRVHEAGGPALLYENVKGSSFRAASNLFGTLERSKFIFRDTFSLVQQLIALKNNPLQALKSPVKNMAAAMAALKAFPLKNPVQKPVLYQQVNIASLPLIRHWPNDGGAFVTLPQVYTEDADKPGILHANLGMYRIQLTGNDYKLNEEAGLHYQLHRGIGVHQSKAATKGVPLKVSVFVGGPPAHALAAVMPLPEGVSELSFAGVLGGRRFRYVYEDGYCISTDADFVLTGEVLNGTLKPEGPFGDHLGYYSLQHPFPVLKIHKVYARKNAIWPFTVVGRPPQEDTSFGNLIHALTGSAIQDEIPGLKEVHAVDAAGVHPLLLAIGSERYTPYQQTARPAEILTIANHILGTGQLSLAKFLFITADDTSQLSAQRIPEFFTYLLERIDLLRDLHFYTNTTVDTLDYSGNEINQGSKVVLAAYGQPRRVLGSAIPAVLQTLPQVQQISLALPGIACLQTTAFENYQATEKWVQELDKQLAGRTTELDGFPLIVLCDNAAFMGAALNNFLWATFTKTDPARDLYGIGVTNQNKHWGCKGPLILDARTKPHHAPALVKDEKTEEKIDRVFKRGGSLYGRI